MGTPPSRKTLIEMCEDETFEASKTHFGWMVYEDGFEDWARGFQRIAA